jgi:hypothetical protein
MIETELADPTLPLDRPLMSQRDLAHDGRRRPDPLRRLRRDFAFDRLGHGVALSGLGRDRGRLL